MRAPGPEDQRRRLPARPHGIGVGGMEPTLDLLRPHRQQGARLPVHLDELVGPVRVVQLEVGAETRVEADAELAVRREDHLRHAAGHEAERVRGLRPDEHPALHAGDPGDLGHAGDGGCSVLDHGHPALDHVRPQGRPDVVPGVEVDHPGPLLGVVRRGRADAEVPLRGDGQVRDPVGRQPERVVGLRADHHARRRAVDAAVVGQDPAVDLPGARAHRELRVGRPEHVDDPGPVLGVLGGGRADADVPAVEAHHVRATDDIRGAGGGGVGPHVEVQGVAGGRAPVVTGADRVPVLRGPVVAERELGPVEVVVPVPGAQQQRGLADLVAHPGHVEPGRRRGEADADVAVRADRDAGGPLGGRGRGDGRSSSR